MLCRMILQQAEVALPIKIIGKAVGPVYSALPYVPRATSQPDSGVTWHMP